MNTSSKSAVTPETEAGRALLAIPLVDGDDAPLDLTAEVLAIEAELRASLAEKVRALRIGPSTDDYDRGFDGAVTRIAALIEGSDPASPEPSEDTEIDGILNALRRGGYPANPTDAARLYDAGLRATPPAGSMIPDRPLDVARLARALPGEAQVLTTESGVTLDGLLFLGSRESIAAVILENLRFEAEAPVTGEDRP